MILNRLGPLRAAASRRGGQPGAPAAADRPLAELAQTIVRLSDHHGSTPVLVTPGYLSLQPPFFAALASEICGRTGRSVRFDWHRRGGGPAAVLADWWAQWNVARINRTLRAVALADGAEPPMRCEIALTATIGRPGGIHRHLVIGWCDEGSELPGWVTPIQLSGASVRQPQFT